MCGICGKLIYDRHARVEPSLLRAMLDTIPHRGPDDEGIYTSRDVGLGHRRLSIIGLSTGHQPLTNEDGTVWVVFNGEIYNYQELRSLLRAKGHVFKTETDTEVIVHLYEDLGEGFIEKLRGMFAIALWDETRKTLLLVRDRVGIKPLYYYFNDKFLVFGSEIKTILADPDVPRTIDPQMIDRFLSFFYMPGEETLLRNVRKLAPGSYLVAQEGKPVIRQYWDLHFSNRSEAGDFKTAKQRLIDLMEETVRLHMISDVPVGLLLSGGVDSSAVLSFVADKTDQPISSYTIGFSDPRVPDERPYARLAAERFGTKHYEMTIGPKEFADFLPKYVWHMEEPVCEPPAVALYYISKLAREHVKVLISGEGGDEAFGGYSLYRNLLWLERLKSGFKPFLGICQYLLGGINRLVGSDRLTRYIPLMGLSLDDYYFSNTSDPFRLFNSGIHQLYSPDFLKFIDKESSLGVLRRYARNGVSRDNLSHMLYLDTKTWLPDDLLIKADKMTMANSIELRVPFLDHKLLEFAASLPANYKVRRFTTKFIAKQAFNNRIPRAIIRRRKAGFPVPYESWLRNEMRSWVRDLLFDRKTRERGYFRPSFVESIISGDLSGARFSKEIFSLVTLELWHRIFLEREVEFITPHSPDSISQVSAQV